MKVVVLDAKSPAPYDGRTIRAGGSEQCVIHVSGALSDRHEVAVIVSNLPRRSEHEIDGVRWYGPGPAAFRALQRADVVVVQRRPELLPLVRLCNVRARLLCWYHDLVYTGGETIRERSRDRVKAWVRAGAHALTRTDAVVVSRFHRSNLMRHLAMTGRLGRGVPVHVAYNPLVGVGPAPRRDFDSDQLIYTSAAWKGLEQVLLTFGTMRESIPSLRLLVATPGYTADVDPAMPGVEFLGSLPRDALLSRVASSLCVFYPADRVPETFGLVFAEAHAVGTPVLAHPFGAAEELLSPEELVLATERPAILRRLLEWREGGRPEVRADPRFDLEAVKATWSGLLDRRSGATSPPRPDDLSSASS